MMVASIKSSRVSRLAVVLVIMLFVTSIGLATFASSAGAGVDPVTYKVIGPKTYKSGEKVAVVVTLKPRRSFKRVRVSLSIGDSLKSQYTRHLIFKNLKKGKTAKKQIHVRFRCTLTDSPYEEGPCLSGGFGGEALYWVPGPDKGTIISNYMRKTAVILP